MTHWTAVPAPRRTAAALAAVLALGACGADPYGPPATDGSTTSTTAAALPPGEGLPPRTDAALAALYGPLLAPLGLEYTRGGVNLYEDGRSHLAVYVAPTSADAASPQDQLDRIIPLVQALRPALFDRFADLDSFDICQEPFQQGGREEAFPPPASLLLMTRGPFLAVDWDTATLADVMAAVAADPSGHFEVDPAIERLPEWEAAVEAAGG